MATKWPVDQTARAREAWDILVAQARKNQPITYGDLAHMMGLHHRACAWFLGRIQEYNKKHGLPPLQSLVVNKHSQVPGGGYYGSGRNCSEVKKAQQNVFDYPWEQHKNPFVP